MNSASEYLDALIGLLYLFEPDQVLRVGVERRVVLLAQLLVTLFNLIFSGLRVLQAQDLVVVGLTTYLSSLRETDRKTGRKLFITYEEADIRDDKKASEKYGGDDNALFLVPASQLSSQKIGGD